ncbi:MAG: ribosome assembly cofactor RimP [Bacteroidota bacterium]
MINKQFVQNIVEEEVGALNIFLIDLQISNSNSIKILLDSEKGVKISDCVKISRSIEHQLDREKEDFELEVSSYGLFSPFKILLHYNKNLGKEVEIYLKEGKNFKGTLIKVETLKNSEIIDFIEISQKRKKKIEGKKKKVEVEEIVLVKIEEIKKIKLIPKF